MKNLNFVLSMLLLAGLIFFNSCKKDEDPTLTLVSLMAGDIDLAGATTASDVPEDAVITATFSSNIDETTAIAANVAVTVTEDGSDVAYTIAVNGAVVTLTPTNGWDLGTQFTIALNDMIMGTNGAYFEGNTLTFRTSGIFVPQKDAQVLFLSFDEGSTDDEAGTHTVSTVSTVSFVEDRWGTAGSAAYFDGNGGLVEVLADDDLISSQMTISFWFKTAAADYEGGAETSNPQTRFVFGLANEIGYFLEMGRRSNDPTSAGYSEIFLKMVSEHENNGTNAATNPMATAWTEVNKDNTVGYEAGVKNGWNYVSDQLAGDASFLANEVMDAWVHMAVVFDGAASTKTVYLNGVKIVSYTWVSSGIDWALGNLALKTHNTDGSAVAGLEASLALGFTGSSTNTATSWLLYSDYLTKDANQKKFFKGSIDQFRIFSTNLNDAEVQMIYDNEN